MLVIVAVAVISVAKRRPGTRLSIWSTIKKTICLWVFREIPDATGTSSLSDELRCEGFQKGVQC